jgi:hypothetical protein
MCYRLHMIIYRVDSVTKGLFVGVVTVRQLCVYYIYSCYIYDNRSYFYGITIANEKEEEIYGFDL